MSELLQGNGHVDHPGGMFNPKIYKSPPVKSAAQSVAITLSIGSIL
jgi:hypothetical protein